MRVQQKAPSLFNTIPSHNYLGVLDIGEPKKIVDYLEFSKTEVASATGVPKISVRYDEKMPRELSQRLEEIAIICELVAGYFDGDPKKTALWFRIKNPLLGDISPRDMIRIGRYQKLVKFIQDALAGHAP